jgi:uncharacterized protein YajQ (UPF0234 family)
MPSFDVVSKVDWAEFANAFTQAEREIAQRFDFKDTETSLEHNDKAVVIQSSTEDRITVLIKEGIETDKCRQIVKLVKDSKLKAQASIHEDSVRVSGKKRDDLQAVIQLLKGAESLELDLQFNNFRD